MTSGQVHYIVEYIPRGDFSAQVHKCLQYARQQLLPACTGITRYPNPSSVAAARALIGGCTSRSVSNQQIARPHSLHQPSTYCTILVYIQQSIAGSSCAQDQSHSQTFLDPLLGAAVFGPCKERPKTISQHIIASSKQTHSECAA